MQSEFTVVPLETRVNPSAGRPELVLTRDSALSRLQSFLTDARKAPKSILQIRRERRWTAASGAWFAVFAALCLLSTQHR